MTRTSPPAPPSPAPKTSAPPTIVPMKSRQKLLAFFAFLLAFWIAMMTVMYFGTVYPRRHHPRGITSQVSPLEPAPPGTPDAPASPPSR